MKKVFKLADLGCAGCAAKMETAIVRLAGVESASINFMTQKLTLAAADSQFDTVLAQAKKIVSKIEPDCVLVV